jgi:hypothetical protein
LESTLKPTLTLKTPGAAPEAETPDPTPAQSLPPDLAAIVAAEVAKAMAARSFQPAAPVTAPVNLPAASEIDATAIERAVLSADGWVCPKPPPAVPGQRMV